MIAGVEVDVKFTLNRNWMIPMEAVDQLCLLVKADDRRSTFSAYVGRMSGHILNAGANRDRKRSLIAGEIKQLRVLAADAPLPPNVLLQMNSTDRAAVLSHRGQEDRFAEFFERVSGQVIGRDVILAIGRRADSLKRVRAIKKRMATGGYALLCGSYLDQRKWASDLGGPVPGPDDWVSIRCDTPEQKITLAALLVSLH